MNTVLKSFQRFWAIVKKEGIQTLRDWPTLAMLIVMPVVELFFVAYMGGTMLEHMPTAVADLSLDEHSRAFITALEVSGFFDPVMYVDSEQDIIHAIDESEVFVGIVIPPEDFFVVLAGAGGVTPSLGLKLKVTCP